MADSENVDQAVDTPVEDKAATAPAAEAPAPAPKAAPRKKLAEAAKEATSAASESDAAPAALPESSAEPLPIDAPEKDIDGFTAAVSSAVLRASVGSDPRWDLLASKRIPAVVAAMKEASNGDLSPSLRNQYAIAAMEGMVTIPRTPVDILAKRAYLAADAVIREQK